MASKKARSASNSAAVVQGGAFFGFTGLDRSAPIESLFGPIGEQARLAGNENPFGPAPSALEAIAKTAGLGGYYADRAVFHLIAMIAERNNVDPSQVILATGSTEILCAASMAWGSRGAIICPDLFWDAPTQFAERKGVDCRGIAMADDMQIGLTGMKAALGQDVSLVYLVNPNNPTGLLLDNGKLRAFAKQVAASGATLLVDEAYNELVDDPDQCSLVDLVRSGEDVIVTRTFSKIYGMAGLRVGYAISSAENIQKIRGYLTSFGGSVPAISAAIGCYEDDGFLAQSKAAIREGRDIIMGAVHSCGLTALPSQTNFIFVDTPDADAVKAGMEARGIVIRGAFGKWKNYSRVSVGKRGDMERFASALPEVIDEIAQGC